MVRSSHAICTWSSSGAHRLMPAAAAARRPRGAGRGRRCGRCRRTCRARPSTPTPRSSVGERRRRGRAPARRSPAARRARGRPRTSTRRSPAAPARCRCCSSPSRGGCAARASAARGGRRGRRRRRCDTPTRRPGQHPLEAGAHRHERGVRAAVEQRDAEALRRADRDVGAELAGGGEQREREQVGGDRDERAARPWPPRPRRAGRGRAPDAPTCCTTTPMRSPSISGSPSVRSATTTGRPIASARPSVTASDCAEQVGVEHAPCRPCRGPRAT